MTVNSFSALKQLRVTFILAPENSNGVFPGTKSNTLILTGLRTIANLQTVPGVPTHADVRIYGMRQEDMNALTTIFFNAGQNVVFNNLIVEANGGNGWNQVFSGMITEAQPEYGGIPAAFFNVQAIVGYRHQITPVPPTSFKGTVAASVVMSGLAANMGLAFENDGVVAQLSNPYFPGTYMDQLNRVCQATGSQYVIAGDTLAVYPQGNSRATPPVLVLSPSSGLIGYPTLEKFGIVTTSFFNPGLVAGGRLKVVDSEVPNANGLWSPFMVDHQLEAYAPGGSWSSVSQCIPVRQ